MKIINIAFMVAALSLGAAMNSPANAEPEHTLRTVFDNDVLVPGSRDQDYTGGMAVSYSGADVNTSPVYMEALLSGIDHLLGDRGGSHNIHTIEVGLYGFTPEETQNTEAGDRPFASILYFSNAHQRVDDKHGAAWQSVLTVGVLGLDVFGDLQSEIHSITGSKQPLGWNKQISDGGELTARYQVARQSSLINSASGLQVNFTQQASVGYITEASIGLSARYGRISSEWWSFRPEMASYGEQSSSVMASGNESYVFGGIALKARSYNAFLQGQFRHSEVSYSSDEVNHGILEVWAGYSHAFNNAYQLSYILRGHTSELKNGVGDRNVIWGGLVLSKNW